MFENCCHKSLQISRNACSSCHFLLNTLKGTAITLAAGILYYSTLSSANRQILTPKRYDEHPHHFYRGVPPFPGGYIIVICTTEITTHPFSGYSSLPTYRSEKLLPIETKESVTYFQSTLFTTN